jgi:hypothetical protein
MPQGSSTSAFGNRPKPFLLLDYARDLGQPGTFATSGIPATAPYTRSMARNLIRFSGGEHAVVDQTTTPPNWSGFLNESPYEATPAAALSTYTLTPCTSIEDQKAIASATVLLTQ